MIQRLFFRSWLVALALGLAAPVPAQTAAGPNDAAGAAEARQDVTATLETLTAAINAAPDDRDARRARGDFYLSVGAFAQAIADFDAVLERAPEDVEALIGRARARSRSGLSRLALADYDAALARAPNYPGLAAERDALAAPRRPDLAYDPAVVMEPAFRVTEGATEAGTDLVIIHAGNDLAAEQAGLPRDALTAARAAGALHITHLFTYTGQDSAIWANLALICAGPAGFDATWQAIAAPDGQSALAEIDAGHGRDAFEKLVTAAYMSAGLAPDTGPDCAFSRTKAIAYLADWSGKREALAGRGPSIYDLWPVYILDGSVVGTDALRDALADLTPAPDARAATEAVAAPGNHPPGPAVEPGQITAASPETIEQPEPGSVAEAQPALETTAGEDAPSSPPRPGAGPPAAPMPAATAPAVPLPDGVGPIDAAARIPPELKGIWAPGLVDCIAYTDAIATPQALDTALPPINPLAGPPVGTVLLTSRRMLLFNTVGTECDLVSTADADEAPWHAVLACRNPVAPELTVPMQLSRRDGPGPAPRLEVAFGTQPGSELVQCRPLGRLSRDFAALWAVDAEACRATAPGADARFTFAANADGVELIITPDTAPADATGPVSVRVDGDVLGRVGVWTDGAWRIPLGRVDSALDRLARGLLLEIRAPETETGDGWSRVLPLLGSGRAMQALTSCAGD